MEDGRLLALLTRTMGRMNLLPFVPRLSSLVPRGERSVLQKVVPAEIGVVSVHLAQDAIRTLFEERLRKGHAKLFRLVRFAGDHVFDDPLAVDAAHEAGEMQLPALHLAVAGDRDLA